ncbi:MAG TPA: LysR family transcriptional regulator [Sandaracinaceae bacterium]
MDLNRVAIFVKVVEEGGFTAAARALGLPKSSVSRAVALLESELGARLLRRSTRAVAMTEAGAAFYDRASRGLGALFEAREAVMELESAVRGTIRVTASVDVGVWMLAPLVARFARHYPEVLVDVVLTGRVVDLVEESFDLAVRAGSVGDEGLAARRLVPAVDFGLYAARSYLERHGVPRRAPELASHRCVLFRASRGRARWTLTGPRGEETVEVSGGVSADDFSFALECVASGAGIGLLPSFVAERGGAGQLVRVLPKHVARGAPLHLVYPADRYLPRRVALFRDFLVAELPRLAAPRTRSRA